MAIFASGVPLENTRPGALCLFNMGDGSRLSVRRDIAAQVGDAQIADILDGVPIEPAKAFIGFNQAAIGRLDDDRFVGCGENLAVVLLAVCESDLCALCASGE